MQIFFHKDAVHSGLPKKTLRTYILKWKTSTDPCDQWFFGKNVPTRIKSGHLIDLMHVHLAPSDISSESYKKWEAAFLSSTSNRKCGREHDEVMFYASFAGDIVVLGFSDHSIFSQQHKIEAMAQLGDRWALSKMPPMHP